MTPEFIKIGEDVRIHPTAVIKQPNLTSLGDHVAIDVGVYISVAAKIGSYVHIAPYVCIIGGADGSFLMEDFTNISVGGTIICVGEDFTQGMLTPLIPAKYRNIINKPVVMKRFSAIGARSTVLQGVVMAEGSVLGANSLLTKSTEPWTIYVGSPARPIRVRNKGMILKGYKELGYEL